MYYAARISAALSSRIVNSGHEVDFSLPSPRMSTSLDAIILSVSGSGRASSVPVSQIL